MKTSAMTPTPSPGLLLPIVLAVATLARRTSPDYTGDQVTTENFFSVLLGNKSAITGEHKKVIHSKPNDHIFIYYSDHGGHGVLGMPNFPYLYAGDFIKVLKKKHASNSY